MSYKHIVFCLFVLMGTSCLLAQVAPDCGNAVPICSNTPVNGGTNGFGNDDFNGASVSGCLEETTTGAIESNSAWYRFRTGASGQLGFNIGIDTGEDWDFALYRTSDCSNLGEPIRCNFYDNQDENKFIGVGEDPTAAIENVQYEDWIQVEPGEDYYLLINNFSNSNSGFSIQFSGQIFVTDPYDALDCSIVSNLLGPPVSACENDIVTLDATTASAIDYEWFEDQGSGFMPIVGENNPTLQVMLSGFYRVNVIVPSNNNIISDVYVVYAKMPVAYAIADAAYCSGDPSFNLSIKDEEVLFGQDESEFRVSYHASQSDADQGVNVLPKEYFLENGAQTIYARVSSVDSPLCFDASQHFQLINLETPVMDFETKVYLCAANANILIGDVISPNSDYTYLWSTGETTSSINVTSFGDYTVTVTNHVSELSCSDTKTITVIESITPEITEVLIDDLQPVNTVTIMTNVTENIEFQLDGGDFQSSNTFTDVLPGTHIISVNDINGCGLVSEEIVVVGFLRFFTPNGDNINDIWHIQGIENLNDPVVHIFDRYGKLLHQLQANELGWNGRFNGMELPSSDYWFKLTYTNADGQLTTAKYINNHFSLRR